MEISLRRVMVEMLKEARMSAPFSFTDEKIYLDWRFHRGYSRCAICDLDRYYLENDDERCESEFDVGEDGAKYWCASGEAEECACGHRVAVHGCTEGFGRCACCVFAASDSGR